MKLGNRIRRLRKNRRATIRDVANDAGISAGYICEIENGRYENPSTLISLKLARYFNVTVEFLFSEIKLNEPTRKKNDCNQTDS